MNRFDYMTKGLNLEGLGLEIGPSHDPLVPKSSGRNVEILDHMDQPGLIEKYKTHGVDTSRIEPVDYIWTGGSLTDCIGKSAHYDWIAASHVIEHTPDMIAFISECCALLKPDGVLALAVPDRRFTFDYFRWPSSTGDVLQAHLDKRVRHTTGQIYDAAANAAFKNSAIAWSKGEPGEVVLLRPTLEHAMSRVRESLDTDQYMDAHGWVFTPSSFRLIISDLNALGHIRVDETMFAESSGCEFYASYANRTSTLTTDRLALMRKAHAEMYDLSGL